MSRPSCSSVFISSQTDNRADGQFGQRYCHLGISVRIQSAVSDQRAPQCFVVCEYFILPSVSISSELRVGRSVQTNR